MRLTSLTVGNYGPFRAQRIGFDAARGRINLLIAPNGAGKSVLRGAFCDLLFGIHPQSDMGFRFGYGGMRLLAEAVGPDGGPFVFGRRKGMGNTLIGADGTPLDPAALARLLGRTDKVLLERLFALDTERLRAGGLDLLASDGDIANALLSAAGGLRHARQLRAALDTQRDALAPERKAQARPFYQALDRFLDARRRIEATVLKPEVREKQQTELAHQRGLLLQHDKQARAASARIAQLERVWRVARPLRQHDDAAAWLAAHADAPTLPADTGARLGKANEALHRADLLVLREREALDEATARADALVCDMPVLDAGGAIDALVSRAGVAAQATRDIPRREADFEREEQRIAGLLHQLGIALPPERATEAIPREAAVSEARRVFAEHEKLRTDLDRLPDELDAAQRDIAATEAQVSRLPPPSDTAALVREARDIRRAGDPAQRAQEAAQAVAEKTATLTAALARIPLWRDRVADLPAQPPATYERLDAARAAAVAAQAASGAALAKLQEEATTEQTRLDEIAAAGTLPDAAAIDAARARRDGGWRLIYRRAFTPDPPPAGEESAWAGDLPLPLAYERAVAAADTLADLRTRESDRLVKTAELTRRLAALDAGIADAETRHTGDKTAHDAALAAWHAALDPLGLDPHTSLAELRTLLAGRDKAIDAQRDVDAATAARIALSDRHEIAAARLAEALGQTAPDLPALLAQADRRIEEAQAADKVRTRLRDRLDEQRHLELNKAAALARAGERMAALLHDWAALRADLHRPENEAPATTVALLDQFARLDAATQAAATLRQRLREMREEVKNLNADAAALAARVAPDVAQPDAVATVDALRRRLAEQRGLAKQRDELLAQVKRAEKSLEAEQKKQSQSAIELRAVLATIGAENVAAAEPLVALAAERAANAETLRTTAEQLAGMGDGRSLDALREETSRFETDAIASERDGAAAERDRAWEDAKTLTARIATDAAEMDAQAAQTATVQAEADRQAAIATLGRVLDEALELHVAGLMLEAALGSVDASGTSALLARIGGLFRTLTGGTYDRIIAEDHGDGGARLLAVEHAFPDEAKPVAALSDGTRDQLFLALRLASIEDHVAASPPLPFVADDILQTFDDARALAAMRALVDLSAHVQVILLSHHAHLLNLADTLGPEQVHVCSIEPAATG